MQGLSHNADCCLDSREFPAILESEVSLPHSKKFAIGP